MFKQYNDVPNEIIGINVLSEMIGLIFFIFTLASCTNNFSENLVMCTVIMSAMQHSGALFNPVVTMNLVLRRRMSVKEFCFLTVTQILSVFMGAQIAYYVTNNVITPSFEYKDDYELAQMFFNELLFTFILLLLINIQITSEIAFTNQKVFTGMLFVFILYTVRQESVNSGSVMNPAVGISLPLVAYMYVDGYDSVHLMWVWVLAPILGGLLAFVFFEYAYLPQALRMRQIKQDYSRWSTKYT